MAKNKVVYGTTVIVDLTDAGLDKDGGWAILSDYSAYGRDGEKINGTLDTNDWIPPQFVKVEYIQSTGRTMFIDTGLKLDGDYEFISYGRGNAPSQPFTLLYSGETSSKRQGGIFYNSARPRYDFFWTGINYTELDTAAQEIVLHNWITVKQNRRTVQIQQGNNIAAAVYDGTSIQDTAEEVYVFYNDRSNEGSKGTIQWAKISKGGVLLRDFVAVKRVVDGVGGLYDKVERQFYRSMGGADFNIGPEL